MRAALFELRSWLGPQKHVFKGNDASDILTQLEKYQDLSCLLQMGRIHEEKKGQKELDKLEELLSKDWNGELTMEDLRKVDLDLSIGTIKCIRTAETEEEVKKLISEYPDAR